MPKKNRSTCALVEKWRNDKTGAIAEAFDDDPLLCTIHISAATDILKPVTLQTALIAATSLVLQEAVTVSAVTAEKKITQPVQAKLQFAPISPLLACSMFDDPKIDYYGTEATRVFSGEDEDEAEDDGFVVVEGDVVDDDFVRIGGASCTPQR